jgi:hypothetical protein
LSKQQPTSSQQPAAKPRQLSRPVKVFEYAAKLVCGVQANAKNLQLTRGFYTTAINIHNPHSVDLKFEKVLSLTYPPDEQKPGDVLPIAQDLLRPNEALAVDCEDIRTGVFPYGFPEPYIKGFVVIRSPQILDVSAVWTTAALDKTHRGIMHSSLDVEEIRPRLIEAVLNQPAALPDVGPDVSKQEVLCAALGQTAAIVEGTVSNISYTFDEAPGEGPREVAILTDLVVHAGGGGVLEEPIEILSLRGFLPNGDSITVSHTPILTPGKRYILFLRNTYWRFSPILLDYYFRRETLQAKPMLVNEAGYGLADIFSGTLPELIFTQEALGETPTLTNQNPKGLDTALTPQAYVDGIRAFAAQCAGPVLYGIFAPFPTVPWDVIQGTPPNLGFTPP